MVMKEIREILKKYSIENEALVIDLRSFSDTRYAAGMRRQPIIICKKLAIDLDSVSTAYISTREELALLKKKEEELKSIQAKREEWMLQELQKHKLKSVRTNAGTIFQTLKESVTVGDWDTFKKWVKENDKFEYLNRAVSKTEVLTLMGEERDSQAPPGINYTAKRTVGIRKS